MLQKKLVLLQYSDIDRRRYAEMRVRPMGLPTTQAYKKAAFIEQKAASIVDARAFEKTVYAVLKQWCTCRAAFHCPFACPPLLAVKSTIIFCAFVPLTGRNGG
jgi:hypothetical protein